MQGDIVFVRSHDLRRSRPPWLERATLTVRTLNVLGLPDRRRLLPEWCQLARRL
jgi:hypothetical protein